MTTQIVACTCKSLQALPFPGLPQAEREGGGHTSRHTAHLPIREKPQFEPFRPWFAVLWLLGWRFLLTDHTGPLRTRVRASFMSAAPANPCLSPTRAAGRVVPSHAASCNWTPPNPDAESNNGTTTASAPASGLFPKTR